MPLCYFCCNQNPITCIVSSWSIAYSRKSISCTKVDGQWDTTINLIVQSIKSILHENKMDKIPPVPQCKNQHGFILRGMEITLLNMQVTNINCGGAMCDGLNMYQNSVTADRCPCYNVLDREGKVCLVLSLKVYNRKNNTNFCIHNHMSKSLTQLFMKQIPKGGVAAIITGNQNHMGNLSRNVMQMLELGNDCDGFNISGWIKHGTIANSGVVQLPTLSK